MDPFEMLKFLIWEKVLPQCSIVNMDIFLRYIGSEGSHRLLQEGYSLFVSSYIHDVWTAHTEDGSHVVVKARCYAKMKKNESPRQLFFEMDLKDNTSSVTFSYCTCKAGQGKCIHIVGLFHLFNHWMLLGLLEIPEESTCTSMEQQWHKPRGSLIEAEPIMNAVFAKPNQKRKRSPAQCSFESIANMKQPSVKEVAVLKKEVAAESKCYPLGYLISSSFCDIQIPVGTVPEGSTLAHQLQLFEPNAHDCIEEIHFPDMPMVIVNPLNIEIIPLHSITLLDAVALEKKTRGQNNATWFKERQIRLTASQFALICKRKKDVNEIFLSNLFETRNLQKINSISYGTRNEEKAKLQYMKQMKTANKNVSLFPSGLIINPGVPFLGCSPDAKIYDENELPQFGLMEVKCPISKRNKTIEEACTDVKFYCTCTSGVLSLKTNSNAYYQVQGQLLLSGAEWCDFVVYNGKNVWIQRIRKDSGFCNLMLNKLTHFYQNHWFKFLQSKLNEV